jgi:putative hydrolase of the HAD superfamily
MLLPLAGKKPESDCSGEAEIGNAVLDFVYAERPRKLGQPALGRENEDSNGDKGRRKPDKKTYLGIHYSMIAILGKVVYNVSMNTIEAVVFDYGGVISLNPGAEKFEAMAGLASVPVADFTSILWGLRNEYDRGNCDCRGFYRHVLKELGHKSLAEERFDALVKADIELFKPTNPETLGLIADLKQQRCKVGVLTNMPYDFLHYLQGNVPLFQAGKSVEAVDYVVASCCLHLLKPEEAIYRVLFDKLRLEPEEIAFFDDNNDNIREATFLGMKAFVFKSAKEARKKLEDLKVLKYN